MIEKVLLSKADKGRILIPKFKEKEV